MDPQPKRPSELTRLYWVAGLLALITMFVLGYKTLSGRVGTGELDAPSRWTLMVIALANVLAIGTLLFIVARSLVKLYFERRSGILGARLRTRLVVTLFAVGVIPSLILFLVGRNFIAKNVERWFSPETEEVITYGNAAAELARADLARRLDFGAARVTASSSADAARLREEAGLDLVARLPKAGFEPEGTTLLQAPSVALGLEAPILKARPGGGTELDTPAGLWLLREVPRGDGDWAAGVFLTKAKQEALRQLEARHRESVESRRIRDTLETLPQSTFLFLTMLTLFFAVWTGLALSRSLSEPIRALAKAAQRVGGGDLEVQLPETGEDELAFLAKSFNLMTRDLKTGREALETQSARLDQQRAYLDQLLAALPVGVLSWRSDGELRTVNAAARSWLGLEAQNLDAEGWTKLSQLPRLGRLPELVAAVREDGKPRSEELRLGGEGEGRPVRVLVQPLSGGGLLALLEDLSQLAEAEKRAAWQEVARRMAHEVKNPLTPIQLTAQRLLRRAREGRVEPEALREGAQTILAEVGSLSRLVDSFSRFARLPQPQFALVDARELLLQVASLYQQNHPGVAWQLELPDDPQPAVWDGDMVKRALINFVDNALGALGADGEAKGRIALRLKVQGRDLRLEVEDDGPGVSPEQRERLFEPYFSTKRKGTGLGLAIVRRIAQDHGGEAAYEPLARGSRFSLRLPAGRA